MIGPDVLTIPAKSQAPLGGSVHVSDMITDDTKVLKDGTVIGTLKNVPSFPEFGSPTSGHFFPATLGSKYDGHSIKCEGSITKTETDTSWVLYVDETSRTFKFTDETDGSTEIVTLKFNKAVLQ